MTSFALKRIGRGYGKNFSPILDYKRKKKIILYLFGGIIFLALFYGYFVNQTVLNVVARKRVESGLIELNSEVSALEVEYINLKNKINLEFAYSLGYKDIPNMKFVSRKTLEKTLTLESGSR